MDRLFKQWIAAGIYLLSGNHSGIRIYAISLAQPSANSCSRRWTQKQEHCTTMHFYYGQRALLCLQWRLMKID